MVNELGITASVILVKPKALAPISVTEIGMVMAVSCVSRNAKSPIEVTELGITTSESLVFLKAPDPILVTEFGIVTEVRSPISLNALSSMATTEFGIEIDLIWVPANALAPTLVTEFGISIDVISQYLNALLAIFFTLVSKITFPLHLNLSVGPTATPAGIITEYVPPPPQGKVNVSAFATSVTEIVKPRTSKRVTSIFFTSSP